MIWAAGHTIPVRMVLIAPMDGRYTDVCIMGEFLVMITSVAAFMMIIVNIAVVNHRNTLVQI